MDQYMVMAIIFIGFLIKTALDLSSFHEDTEHLKKQIGLLSASIAAINNRIFDLEKQKTNNRTTKLEVPPDRTSPVLLVQQRLAERGIEMNFKVEEDSRWYVLQMRKDYGTYRATFPVGEPEILVANYIEKCANRIWPEEKNDEAQSKGGH